MDSPVLNTKKLFEIKMKNKDLVGSKAM